MDYRRLGTSGLKVPALSFGTGTFGGSGPLFGAWGKTDSKDARRLVDICLEAGVTLFDTADVYSNGASERVLGEAIRGRRDQPFPEGSRLHETASYLLANRFQEISTSMMAVVSGASAS